MTARRAKSGDERSFSARWARWALNFAARHWPHETRDWGLALAAEVDEATTPIDALRWSAGGIIFFARASLLEAWKWLNLPVGGSQNGVSGEPLDSSLMPRRSRLFTVAVLTTTVMMLSFPSGREAVRTVRASWHDFVLSPSDRQTLDRLAARAEKEKDAETLAFVALSRDTLEDVTHENLVHFEALADRAVTIDPNLVWIYGVSHRAIYGHPREEIFERLRSFDPENAVPDLLAATAIRQAHLRGNSDRGSKQVQQLETLMAVDQNRVQLEKLETLLAGDQKWIGLMERAFAARKYDSYFLRQYELTRTVWSREGCFSPQVIFWGTVGHAVPDFLNLRTFSKIKTIEAREAFAAGHFQQGEELLGAVNAFGIQMASESQTDIEKSIGMTLSRQASQELVNLETNAGRRVEAQKYQTRAEQLDERFHGKLREDGREMIVQMQFFRRWGILVQSFAILVLVSILIAAAGSLVLELLPRRFRNRKTSWKKALCWAADYGPTTLLVACGAFLLSFLPYSHALAAFRSSGYKLTQHDSVMLAFGSLSFVPIYLSSPAGTVLLWLAVTAVLSGLVFFVVARSFYSAKHIRT
jgi:hypothetical protein